MFQKMRLIKYLFVKTKAFPSQEERERERGGKERGGSGREREKEGGGE